MSHCLSTRRPSSDSGTSPRRREPAGEPEPLGCPYALPRDEPLGCRPLPRGSRPRLQMREPQVQFGRALAQRQLCQLHPSFMCPSCFGVKATQWCIPKDHTKCVVRALVPTLAVFPPHACHRRETGLSRQHMQQDVDIFRGASTSRRSASFVSWRSRLKTHDTKN